MMPKRLALAAGDGSGGDQSGLDAILDRLVSQTRARAAFMISADGYMLAAVDAARGERVTFDIDASLAERLESVATDALAGRIARPLDDVAVRMCAQRVLLFLVGAATPAFHASELMERCAADAGAIVAKDWAHARCLRRDDLLTLLPV